VAHFYLLSQNNHEGTPSFGCAQDRFSRLFCEKWGYFFEDVLCKGPWFRPFDSAQGRLFREERERWGTQRSEICAFPTCVIPKPPRFHQRGEGSSVQQHGSVMIETDRSQSGSGLGDPRKIPHSAEKRRVSG
jgi:hypothetical protein